jgi:hypothetical protein
MIIPPHQREAPFSPFRAVVRIDGPLDIAPIDSRAVRICFNALCPGVRTCSNASSRKS